MEDPERNDAELAVEATVWGPLEKAGAVQTRDRIRRETARNRGRLPAVEHLLSYKRSNLLGPPNFPSPRMSPFHLLLPRYLDPRRRS